MTNICHDGCSEESIGDIYLSISSSCKFRLSRELHALNVKGGKGGRLVLDKNDWNYFPKHNKHSASLNDDGHNEFDTRTSNGNNCVIEDDVVLSEDYKHSYQIVNITALKEWISEEFVCKCNLQRQAHNFFNYCASSGNTVRCDHLKSMWKE